jgi:hypothetical protein
LLWKVCKIGPKFLAAVAPRGLDFG